MGEQSLPERFDMFSSNIMSSAMINVLADDIGVSPESMIKLGIGYSPCDGAFVTPERDCKGKLVGVVRRFNNGQKIVIAGSKRGLCFEVNPDYVPGKSKYDPGKHNFMRISLAGVNCPVCGRGDWCLVSAENPYDPAAVICGRTKEGARKCIENDNGFSGYLHILKPEGEVGPCGPLKDSDLPVIITEGYSDTAAAADLGFVVLGRATAETCIKDLPNMVRGRAVIIVGDADKTKEKAGQRGMESAFATCMPVCPSVTKVLPPEPYKVRRRAWRQ